MRGDLGDDQRRAVSAFEARREAPGWCVIGPGFYLHHRDREICEAMAALLNGYTERAAQIVERWRA